MLNSSRRLVIGSFIVLAMVAAVLAWRWSTGGGQLGVEDVVHCQIEGCVAGSVGTTSGRLWLEHEDISSDPTSGLPGLRRSYFRNGEQNSSFGPGWRSILDTRLEERNGGHMLVGFPSLPAAPLGLDGNVVTFAEGTRWVFDDSGLLTGLATQTGRRFDLRRGKGRVALVEGERTLIDMRLKGERVDRVIVEWPHGVGDVRYGYDDGRLTSVTSTTRGQEVDTFRYSYNPDGGLKRIVSASGDTRISWADQKAVGQITVGGQTTKLELASRANEATLVTPPGATRPTEYLHDHHGRLVQVRQGTSVPLLREYNADGRLVRERGSSDDRRFTWNDGRLTKVESTARGTTVLAWDDLGRLTSATVGKLVTTYEYEDSTWAPVEVTSGGASTVYRYRNGRLVKAVDPDGVSTKVGKTDSARLVIGADAIGEEKQQCTAPDAKKEDCASSAIPSFDNAGRPTGVTLGDSKGSVSYDEYGRVESTSGPNGVETTTYDERGRVASSKRGDVTFANAYERDRLVRVTANGEEFARFTYDLHGRVTSIEDGGLEWKVADFSSAGRPKRINTPYGLVAIHYDSEGRPDRTEVSEHDRPDSRERIITTFDWKADGAEEIASMARGGYLSTLTFHNGALMSARTPIGRWKYSYSAGFPGHLSGVSGPDGDVSYTYADMNGAPQLTRVDGGGRSRTFEWDSLGRLTAIGGDEPHSSFEYRQDGITESVSGRSVTWNEAGLPEAVESHEATETWDWNPDRTLKSITSDEGRGPWQATYDSDKRLSGFDHRDSDDGISVKWTGDGSGPARPSLIEPSDAESRVALQWTEAGELQSAKHRDQEWSFKRDSHRNVTEVTREGETSERALTTWKEGLPVALSSGDDSLSFDGCREVDCAVDLTIGDQTIKVDFSEGAIVTDADGRKTGFTTENGSIAKGCQQVDGDQTCTTWPVTDGSGLARFEELFGGTDGQLRGLASRPLPPDPPAISELPDELKPAGLDIELPDEALEEALAAAIPSMPETFRLEDDGAAVRIANRLAPASIAVSQGPGQTAEIAVFGDDTLGEFESPFREDSPLGRLAGALQGIEPNSLLGGVKDAANTALGYLPQVLDFAAELFVSLFTGGVAGTVGLVVAAGACIAGSTSCAALAVSAALMLIPGIGYIAGVLLPEVLAAIADGVLSIARGASWEEVAIGAGTAILVGVVAGQAIPVQRLCRTNRVWCLDAARSPEAAANAAEARHRLWGVLAVDRANTAARRSEALHGVPTRPGLDRDEFPPAVTRQGGAGARVAHINPGDNRAAGASLRNAISGLDDGQRFLYLVVDSRDRPLTMLNSAGADAAISFWATAR